MAVVKAPLMSLAASGSVGKAITFSKWKGRAYVRTLVKPKQPRTGLQVSQRAALKFSSQSYKTIGATPQANWKVLAKVKNVTPLNAMIRVNQRRNRQGFGAIKDPNLAAGAVEAAPTTVVATAQPVSVKLTWVDSAGAQDWGTYIYRSLTTAFTPGPSTLVQIVTHGVLTYQDVKLKTGTQYFYRLGGVETGGTLGTLAAEVNATPT